MRSSSFCVPIVRKIRKKWKRLKCSGQLNVATNDTVYLFVPENRSTPERFLWASSWKMQFFFLSLSIANVRRVRWKKPVANADVCVRFNRYPIRKKGWSIAWASGNVLHNQIAFLNYYSIQSGYSCPTFIPLWVFRAIKRYPYFKYNARWKFNSIPKDTERELSVISIRVTRLKLGLTLRLKI